MRDSGGPAVRKTRVNYEIRLTPIRLIDENNQQVGVVETREAMRMAEEAGLDLVEIQADVRPPLCKIMDYGKFRYELSKKQKGNPAGKAAEMKEVRLGRSIKIDDHDVQIRVNQARKFLMDGHKVLLVQNFRGREMAHKEIGEDRMKDVCEALSDIAKVDGTPKLAGRRMNVILIPDRVKVEAAKRAIAKAKAAEAKAKGEPEPKDDAAAEKKPDPAPAPAPEPQSADKGE